MGDDVVQMAIQATQPRFLIYRREPQRLLTVESNSAVCREKPAENIATIQTAVGSSPDSVRLRLSANLEARAGTGRPGSDFKLELSGRLPPRRDSRFLPAVCPHWRRLSLVPGQHAMRSCPLAEAHGLRAGQPFFGLFGNLQQQRFELRPRGLQNVRLRQPTHYLASGNSHALPR